MFTGPDIIRDLIELGGRIDNKYLIIKNTISNGKPGGKIMREFRRVSLDGKGGDIFSDRLISPGSDIGTSSKYSRPTTSFASEGPESSFWAWKGSAEPIHRTETGVKPVPANKWKAPVQSDSEVAPIEPKRSEFTWKLIRDPQR